MLILSIPAVQTKLGKYATKRVNDEFGTNINISKVGLQFNGDVELKNVYIEDYRQDTLININELNTSIISFRNLTQGNLAFGDIDIMDLTFNVKTYAGENQTNLDVFVQRFETNNPKDPNANFLMSSSDVSIYDGIFRLIDENRESQKVLEFYDLNINATKFLIHNSEVGARINTLNFKDTRGAFIKNMVTDFQYTLTSMNFDNLSITTEESNLQGDLRFDYNREDFIDFENKVQVTANFVDSKIYLNDLNTFYNEFGINQTAYFNAKLSGTLNDLKAENLQLRTDSRTRIYGDLNFKNLFSKEDNNFVMQGRLDNLSSTYYDLRSLLPNLLGESIPSAFSKVGYFTITGTTYITKTDIDADLQIQTDIGRIDSKMKMRQVDNIDNAGYKGWVVFDDFNVGKLMEDPNFGKASFDVNVNGRGFTLDNLNSEVKGKIFDLTYNNYTYRGIDVSGRLGNNLFNGFLQSNDPNFKFKFDGLADLSEEIKSFDFRAEVEYANLNLLNFVKKDSISEFRGTVDMLMNGSNVNNAFGTLNFKNTTYKNEHEEYLFKDFTIVSSFDEDKHYIKIESPDIIDGQMSGNFRFEDIGKLVENSLGSIYTNYEPHIITSNQRIDFDFKIYSKIIEVFYNDLQIGSNTTIKGHLETNENNFSLEFDSPSVKLKDYFANNISVSIDNSNPLYNTFIEIDSLNTKFYAVSDVNLINVTKRDTLFIKSEFKGGKNNRDQYDLNMFYTIDELNKSVVGFNKSDVIFKENEWTINENRNRLNKVTFDRQFKNFDIDEFVMSHYDEEILLFGVLRDSTYKDIELNFTDVDLLKITPRIDSLTLEGNVNGNLKLTQENGVYLPASTLVIDGFSANKYELGVLTADIVGNNSLTSYNVDVNLENDNVKALSAVGSIDVNSDNPTIDLDIAFEEFLLDPLDPFGQGVITNIRGEVTGNVKATGSLRKPEFNGDLLLDNAGLTIPYLNVDYGFDFDSQVKLENQRFIFREVEITDSEFFSRATLNGFIAHNNFSDWRLGLDISSNRLLVLNTEYDEEQLYYGTGFINGIAAIDGPTDELVISVDGSTAEGTVFKIPLNDLETYGDNSYIHFLSPEEKEARLRGEQVVYTEVKGLELQFDLIVNPYADIEIVIDRNSGSTIQGAGNGNLLFDINTNGKFRMFGDFSIVRGVYNFAYGGLVQKRLDVEPGGFIRWEGDPLRAQIGLTAVYRTEANPSVLLDNPISRSIPVEVEVNLSGQLEQPEPDFTFNFPNVSSVIKSELDYRLETKESRTNQALFLLSTGSFASELSLGQQAYGTISDRVNAFFNSFLTNADDKLQVGVNYQVGEQTTDYTTDDRLGLTLSTKISDRVLINGKVGVPIGGVNQTVIAGDVQIDILLNQEGTLTAKFFNRENSIRNFGEEIGYTQGLGIAYNVEFDTFKELFEIIFTGKNKKEPIIIPEKEEEEEENLTPSYINIKSEKD